MFKFIVCFPTALMDSFYNNYTHTWLIPIILLNRNKSLCIINNVIEIVDIICQCITEINKVKLLSHHIL